MTREHVGRDTGDAERTAVSGSDRGHLARDAGAIGVDVDTAAVTPIRIDNKDSERFRDGSLSN